MPKYAVTLNWTTTCTHLVEADDEAGAVLAVEEAEEGVEITEEHEEQLLSGLYLEDSTVVVEVASES